MQTRRLKAKLIRTDLYIGVLPPWRAACCGRVSIGFIVEQIEGLLTGTRDIRDTATVSHGELELDIDAEDTSPWDEVCPQPVVLIGLQDVTHLVRPDGAQVVVVSTYFLPLRRG